MINPNSFGQAECKKQPIAHEISALAAITAEQAEKTSVRAGEKLMPICTSSAPVCENENCGASREYPPFFSDLRDKLLCIERALNKINNVLDRAEI